MGNTSGQPNPNSKCLTRDRNQHNPTLTNPNIFPTLSDFLDADVLLNAKSRVV